jgi:hypothetical protein
MLRALYTVLFLFPLALSAQEVAQTVPGGPWGVGQSGSSNQDSTAAGKPVIYLYPSHDTLVSVKISGVKLVNTYPAYDAKSGWKVLAQPNGTLVNIADNREYSYLFWDGTPLTKLEWDHTSGELVEGTPAKTGTFLRDKLSASGLTPREYNEFIVYWMPKLTVPAPAGYTKWNLIHFATKAEYADKVSLEIAPKPASVLRVYMFWEPVNSPNGGCIDMAPTKPQTFTAFKRIGFTVVEWGGEEKN